MVFEGGAVGSGIDGSGGIDIDGSGSGIDGGGGRY